MATKIGGRARVFINGVQYPLRGDVLVMTGDTTRTSVTGLDGYHGVTETPAPCYAEFTLSHLPTVDINMLQSLSDATVTLQFDNGTQAVLRNAAQVNPVELTGAEGQFTLRFEGPSGVWL
jgi:hypothetical protein